MLFTILDQHADTVEGDIKHPLVILGNEGSGKSAFLANWVMRRREHKHKEEFLFQHFVGCSARSSQLGPTLFRLEKALKDFFQLREMEVPDSEERLRWSLNRFLAAAAKKHSPARIVVIIDGVNNLKGEATPRGTLHWLPSELPPCVRFIVSTTEYEKGRPDTDDDEPQSLNRTFMELTRRKCPVVPMESLSVNTRNNIINEFINTQPGDLILQETNQFKIVTAPASAQPLFLRSLLQALRLSVSLTNLSVENLLETFSRSSGARELIHKMLNICYNAVSDDPAKKEMLGKMLSVIYVSRDGLTEDEVWRLLRLVTRVDPDEHTQIKLLAILKELTMVVNDLYSFSHEIYREVVYEKYIKTPDALVRWHFVLARFFSQFEPGPRKLNCLPYHLQVAGAWSKVKNCLTDIEMFLLWWTAPFKADFMKFWASLTAKNQRYSNVENRGSDNGSQSSEQLQMSNRPTYDIVEEYVKSLDEFRASKHPTEERVADIILKVAEFMIEFATLGHEIPADVPFSIHPVIPIEDLKSIGVPHLSFDKEGRSCMIYPSVYPELGVASAPGQEEVGPGEDIPSRSATKAPADIPIRTAYFFNRWMWIQFPYIALGNCYDRFYDGVEKARIIAEATGRSSPDFPLIDGPKKEKPFFKKSFFKEGMSLSKSMPLPEVTFVRKAARSFPRPTAASQAEIDPTQQFQQRLINLQDSIRNLKEEYDFLCQQKNTMDKQLYQLKGTLVELVRAGESTSQFDGTYAEVSKREQIATEKYHKAAKYHANLANLQMICERHPPHMPALITEVENKLDQDADLIAEIKKRLWEQKFEHNIHKVKFKEMKVLVREGVKMHTQLVDYRMEMKKRMQKQAAEDTALLTATNEKKHEGTRRKRISDNESLMSKENDEKDQYDEIMERWEDKWDVVASRTGIDDPNVFFKRIDNRKNLEDQIVMLRRAAESKLEQLKKDAIQVETELEEVRVEASLLGGHGRENSELSKKLADAQTVLRRRTELTETHEHLQTKAWEGLRHISEMLGDPLHGLETLPIADAPAQIAIKECVEKIDATLDRLIEEKEKMDQNSLSQDSVGPSRIGTGKDSNPETSPHVKEELAHVLDWVESPKARLPQTLPSRKIAEDDPNSARSDKEADEDDEGMWNRSFAKSELLKTGNLLAMKDARAKKKDDEKA